MANQIVTLYLKEETIKMLLPLAENLKNTSEWGREFYNAVNKVNKLIINLRK